MQARELQALVLGEAALVAVCGLAAGLLVGTGMAYLLVHVLRALFILDPGVTFPAGDIAALATLVLAATLASAADRDRACCAGCDRPRCCASNRPAWLLEVVSGQSPYGYWVRSSAPFSVTSTRSSRRQPPDPCR